MNINELLGGVKCQACGKPHNCDIESIFVESGAISHLGRLCEKYEKILIVADENTYGVAGDKTLKALDGKEIESVIFDGSTVLIPDERAIERVRAHLDGVNLIVGIGSGVIQDLCKYVSFFAHLPYMIVATAPSMDGYASNGAAMILGGMKETVSAHLPRAIIADVDVLKNAPMEMIKAGYGDIIGKYSALNDWKLSRAVNGEYFCQYIYDITYDMIGETLKTAKGLLKRDDDAVKALTEALMIVGVMMSFATTSRPASGSEHHLSHYFEITGIVNGEKYLAHGVDVAYSTVITARIREEILKKGAPSVQFVPERAFYEAKIKELYGESVGEGCIALQDKIGNYKRDRAPAYNEKWSEISKILSEMPSGEEIEKMLALAELDVSELYDTYGEKKINDAVLYAKDLKDRYTVLWLNYDMRCEG
jgi:glycerol-1-phosphate dehydrogenase [NAD(P)+]